jgi:TRAP-type C4-dicarboxylate transport system permease small subunit
VSIDEEQLMGTGSIGRLSQFCAALERRLGHFVCFIFALMLLIGALQIANRYLLGTSLSWSEELQRYLLVWLVFLSIPLAYRHGRHIGVELVRDRLHPTPARLFDRAINLLWLLVFAALCGFTVQLMSVARYQITPGLGLRMDWVYSGVLLGAAIVVLFALQALLERSGKDTRR